MKRREFIMLIGGAAVAWPLAARAQQAGKLPTIGFFSAGSAAALGPWVAALVQLRELGWSEGHTVAIEYRWADGRDERLAEIAAEFVQRRVDIIVTHSAAPVVAAKQATSTIPIVFALAADPLGTGLVASLARPGGNVTGLSFQSTDFAAKRLELLREVVPSLRRLAILGNVGNPANALEMRFKRRPARSALRSARWKSGAPRISRPPSTVSETAPNSFLFVPIRCSPATASGSTSWRQAPTFQRFLRLGSMSRPEGSYPTDRTSRTCSDAPATTSTRFCAGQSQAISRSSSRPSSS